MSEAPRSSDPVRAVVMCCDDVWQRAMAQAIAAEHDLVGIVIVEFTPPDRTGRLRRVRERLARYANPFALVRHVLDRWRLRRREAAAEPLVRALFHRDGEPPRFPEVPTIRVSNVNDPYAVAFVRDHAPDVVCVNGTNLLRAPMLDLIPEIPLGIVNLHTGLSPYARGGNCNLFMLLEGRPELVGVTIHHIDRGIDSGDIVRTARPELSPTDTFETIRTLVWRLGIDLLVESIADLAAGRARRVKQWTDGTLFLRRTGYRYSPRVRVRANRRLRKGLIADYLADREARDREVRLVGPDDPGNGPRDGSAGG